jgi:hypothetical protein
MLGEYVHFWTHHFVEVHKVIITLGRQMIFKYSPQDSRGEKHLVNIIEDWEIFEKYRVSGLGVYQVVESDGIFEIRVLTGNIGYKREFPSAEDPLLVRILAFCQRNRYSKISTSEPVGVFFN